MIRMKIKDICDLQNGRAFKPSDWGTAGLPIIRIQNLNDERAPFNYYGGKYNLAQEVDNGDLLFSWSGTPGTSFGAFLWNRGKGVLNQHIFKVIPKVEVDKTYLMYALNGNISTIISKAHGGVGLQHITKKELDEIEIQMVSISRQKEIVEILEKISLLIFLRKQQLSKLDELVKARFVEMFGDPFEKPRWPLKKLKNISENISDGSNIDKAYYQKNGDILFLRIQNVWSNEFRLEDSVYISTSVNEKYHSTSLRTGDLLITKIGRYYTKDSSLGRVAIYRGQDGEANYSNNIMGVTLTKDVLSGYVNILMNLDSYKQYIRKVSVGGTDKRALSKTIIEDFPIIVPPMKNQKQFATFAERVDQQKRTVQQSLEKLELMKKALMQEYFG